MLLGIGCKQVRNIDFRTDCNLLSLLFLIRQFADESLIYSYQISLYEILNFLLAILRKAVDQFNIEGLLAVYLSFPSGCQFHVLNPTLNGQQIKINQIHTFPGPEVSYKSYET